MKSLLITGGAGFIGSNAAHHFDRAGWRVVIFDNLSRRGAGRNLDWIREKTDVEFVQGDLRRPEEIESVFEKTQPEAVLHLGGQVAVTTSVVDPREDFEVNALGTFNVLEALRRFVPHAPLVYSSTNKVYGKMDQAVVVERDGRYAYRDQTQGIDEQFPLDFHSPYGCSKGAGDQYVLDYARIYDLKLTSFRQSCIYGPRQFGVEDQGWIAWFTIATRAKKPITIYGDGKQVRDVLHVDDLIRLYEMALQQPDRVAGEAFNVGGGPENTLSLLELVQILESRSQEPLPFTRADWRPGDQKVFVCDIRKIQDRLGWTPATRPAEGVGRLADWVEENLSTIQEALG
ncbi:MAG: SDR family NAD(P)-dependent oxidoreductase [Planctomycetota bacterium]|jgi:CDP-paratose 2-epimerase|nr:SDR family NAD(P)-dependent oxidoreductase [Planctomycetota bacterium]